MKEKVNVTGVPETMIQTLYARAKESGKKDAKIKDDMAMEIVSKLDYDFSKADQDKAMSYGVIARTIVLDHMVEQYLQENPNTIVVNIACGMDTRCYRMQGKYLRWYNIDLPETMRIRSQFLKENGPIFQIAKSAMDASYIDEMTYNGENVLVVIEGLSMYLSEPDIRQIFRIIENAFQNTTVLIETMSPFVVSHIREQLFVTSKVAAEQKTYEEAAAGIDETLKKMGLDYLDMMIIHSPQPWVEVNQSDDRYVEGNRAAWKALEDAYKAGKLKAIGVSNFQIGDIESLLETARIKPMVNQVLLHISNTPLELVEYCQKNDIAIEAYSPIAHGVILDQPEIADKYGVTVPQLCIRYTLQLGTISLPKTANPEHMKTNAEVDFVISDADMETLKAFKHIEDYGESGAFSVYGGKL